MLAPPLESKCTCWECPWSYMIWNVVSSAFASRIMITLLYSLHMLGFQQGIVCTVSFQQLSWPRMPKAATDNHVATRPFQSCPKLELWARRLLLLLLAHLHSNETLHLFACGNKGQPHFFFQSKPARFQNLCSIVTREAGQTGRWWDGVRSWSVHICGHQRPDWPHSARLTSVSSVLVRAIVSNIPSGDGPRFTKS